MICMHGVSKCQFVVSTIFNFPFHYYFLLTFVLVLAIGLCLLELAFCCPELGELVFDGYSASLVISIPPKTIWPHTTNTVWLLLQYFLLAFYISKLWIHYYACV